MDKNPSPDATILTPGREPHHGATRAKLNALANLADRSMRIPGRPEAAREPAVPKTDLGKCQEVMDAAIEADALARSTAKGVG